MWKTCHVKCGGLCRISLDGRPCLPVCMACGAVQVEASRRGGWMGFFYLHDKVVFAIEPVVVLSRWWFFLSPALLPGTVRRRLGDARVWRWPAVAAKPQWMHVVCADPPPKGWGRNQRIYLAWENRRTDPKRTAHKKGEVIRKFGPWMDFWVLKGIRKIPLHKTWTKNVVDRDWFRVPAGTPGPDGLKACVSVCQMLQPGQKLKGLTVLPRRNGTRRHGHTASFFLRNL